ncbi:hypothetical protein J3367_05625 [Aurantimonas sp. NFXS3]
MSWNLHALLSGLHEEIQDRLERARNNVGHPVAKGDATEGIWIELLQTYLPRRYTVDKAFVCDSKGQFSDQIDIVIYDRQYTPITFQAEGNKIIPAESVYAVFEAKQSLDARNIAYARKKAATVRALHRTSLPIPTANGVAPARAEIYIFAGILTFESEWKPALGRALTDALVADDPNEKLDLGCVAAHGTFESMEDGGYRVQEEGRPAAAFLFELITRLQFSATVPMLDLREYAKWLAPEGQSGS